MKQKASCGALIALAFFLPMGTVTEGTIPQTPHAGVESGNGKLLETTSVVADIDYPVWVRIPSVGIDSPIEKVGVNSRGEMDVPDGRSNRVGWYQYGTVPGSIGSAVLDAHVFAAFKNLKNVRAGSDIYLSMASGKTLRFIVEEARTYALSRVPLWNLFARADRPRLNLITCAGKLTPDRSTYEKRLIAYAVLAPDPLADAGTAFRLASAE